MAWTSCTTTHGCQFLNLLSSCNRNSRLLWVGVQIPTSGSSTRQDIFLCDFYEENVLWTKCRRSTTFSTFLGLDVLSNCKNTEKSVNSFLMVIYGLWEVQKSDNGQDKLNGGEMIWRWVVAMKSVFSWWIVGCEHASLVYWDGHRRGMVSKICG